MKKYLSLVFLAFLAVLLILAFLCKSQLDSFISGKMKEQSTATDSISVTSLIYSKYNYSKNELNFDFTLLEFGSTGCTVCKQMEPVLEEMRRLEKPKVNVVFLNIMHPENLSMMKYFGISAVPMQILLDKTGQEYFRHYGFIPFEKLNQELVSK